MRTFKQFLSEMTQTDLTVEEAARLIKKNSSNYCKKNLHIWRGINSRQDAIYGKSSEGEDRRSSGLKSNLYSIFMDQSPDWEGFPKRGKSFICTTEAATAHTYGNLYMVFPADDAKIAKVPAHDLWAAFKPEMGGIMLAQIQDDIVDFLTIGFKYLNRQTPPNLYDANMSYEDVCDILKQVTRMGLKMAAAAIYAEVGTEEITEWGSDNYQLQTKAKRYTKLLDLLRSKEYPSMLELFRATVVPDMFEMTTGSEMDIDTRGDYELYVEGDVVMVRKDHLDELLELLKA